MKVLVVGASGATGQLVVKELLSRGYHVRIVIRSIDTFPDEFFKYKNLSIIEASLLDYSDSELTFLIAGCDAVISCLGHNLSFKGIYGQPRRLVTQAVHRLCDAIKFSPSNNHVKFILMNTAGNSNRDHLEEISFAQKCVMGLIRLILPPHIDNEMAADYLRIQLGQLDSDIEWTVVRPDGLIDEEELASYEIHSSPTRSAIFDAGKTSRLNVAHFMAELISNEETWRQWKGKMPVIYNESYQK